MWMRNQGNFHGRYVIPNENFFSIELEKDSKIRNKKTSLKCAGSCLATPLIIMDDPRNETPLITLYTIN